MFRDRNVETLYDELMELTIRENRTEKENDRLKEPYATLDQLDSEECPHH